MSLITTTTPPPTTRPCCYATALAKSSCNKRNIIIKQHSSAITTFPLAFSHYYSLFNYHSRNVVSNKRRRFTQSASCSLVLPLLPFPLEQVLVPSESKTLHLYEARYLELLEESISRKKKLFVHFVLDPIVVGYGTAEASFAARYGCLVAVDKVERLDVGALVSIRGIGRVTITQFMQADPYLMGLVLPLMDNIPSNLSSLDGQVSELKQTLYSLNSLEIKLKATKDEILQTQTANSLLWSENKSSLDCDDAFIPSVAERVSFSALQPISGSSQSELLELQKEKLKAMDIKETPERLDFSLNFVKKNISMLAAKVAIQSLELQ